MIWDIVIALGGVGLFLLGMTLLTDGLKALSGESLRHLLARQTQSPFRGVIAGAVTTAVVQSSSATTVTVVGFVGAGLLTFQQGLGVVLGANIGTTVTGWLIAIFGFKLKIGVLAFPLVFAGALMRLFAHGGIRHAGWVLAGFGLLFVGIDTMQQGMASFQGVVTPDAFPGNDLAGRFQLLLLGAVLTMITQSSSAGVAAALVALGAGAISFHQAVAMVIGMNIGTTVTALLATLGGSTAVRRTGVAHVIFNVTTAAVAFFLIDPYVDLAGTWVAAGSYHDAQLSLVAFHTLFNVLGVVIMLPVAGQFARLVIRLVPDRGPALLRRLDDQLLAHPAASIDAASGTLREIIHAQAAALMGLLSGERGRSIAATLENIGQAIETTREFVGRIKTGADDPAVHRRHESIVHALDHAQRLHHRCTQEARIRALRSEHQLRRLSRLVREAAHRMIDGDDPGLEDWLDRLRALLRRRRRNYRIRTVDAAAEQRIGAGETLGRLDAIRWLHRVAYHLWRLQHHLSRAVHDSPPDAVSQTMPSESELDVDED